LTNVGNSQLPMTKNEVGQDEADDFIPAFGSPHCPAKESREAVNTLPSVAPGDNPEIKSPAPPTPSEACKAVLAKCRKWLEGRDFFHNMDEHRQKQRIKEDARMLTLFRTPLGWASLCLYDAAEQLRDAINAFLDQFPDDAATHKVAEAALVAAGLESGTDLGVGGYRKDHFDSLPEMARGWKFLMDHLFCDLGAATIPEVYLPEVGGVL
jgi:hypothetical protein